MALKHVVLPAPFGPMRPKISWGWMAKLTSCRATRPPKRMVSPSSQRTGSAMFDGLAPVFELSRATPVRHDALGPEDHHHDEGGAEDQDAVFGEAPEPLGEVADHDGAHDGAQEIAGAAEHHAAEEQDRQHQREGVRRDRPGEAGV